MVVYSKQSYRYRNWNNSYINRWGIDCDFQDTIQDNQFFRDRYEKKKESKAQRIEFHHRQIFQIYENWTNTPFLIDIELTQFDLNNLRINVVEQIVPINNSNNANLIRLEERAIAHLNCDDYRDVYNRFKEIEDVQNNINNSIIQFLDNHRDNLIRIITTENFTPPELSMNTLLRYLFHKAILFNGQSGGVSV